MSEGPSEARAQAEGARELAEEAARAVGSVTGDENRALGADVPEHDDDISETISAGSEAFEPDEEQPS